MIYFVVGIAVIASSVGAYVLGKAHGVNDGMSFILRCLIPALQNARKEMPPESQNILDKYVSDFYSNAQVIMVNSSTAEGDDK